MKINLTYLVLIVTVTLVALSACKKEEGYNWQNIEPGKQEITGPDSIKGNDSTSYEFLALPRGGSTYTWEVLNGPITISVDTLKKDPLHYHPYRAVITASSLINTTASIVVRETTWAGKQGESDTFNIRKIFCYWPFNNNDFVGQYRCTEQVTNYLLNNSFNTDSFNVNISYVGGDTFLLDNFFGSDFKLNYILSKDKNETLNVVKKFITNITYSNFNGDLDVKGQGIYSTCSGTIKVNLAMIDHALGDTVFAVTDYFKRK